MNFAQKITNLSYLFDPYPTTVFNYYWPLIIFFILIFLSGFILAVYIRKNKISRKLFKKYPRRLKIIGIIGLLLLGCRYQGLPYLSIRFWLILINLWLIISLSQIIYLYFSSYPQEVSTIIQDTDKNKYLPKKKKK